MSGPKAQFQLDNGSGWQTVAEVDIIDGVAHAPNEWTMVRALRKQIVYTGCVSEEITTVPSNPRETHFSGFAEELFDELIAAARTFRSDLPYPIFSTQDVERFEESQQKIIARRAYDLVEHILWYSIPAIEKYKGLAIEEIASMIPDLTELPEEEHE